LDKLASFDNKQSRKKCQTVTSKVTAGRSFILFDAVKIGQKSLCRTTTGVKNSNRISDLRMGPSKLDCYVTLGWKGLPWTNALAYSAHL
jgi:hypothetical protein